MKKNSVMVVVIIFGLSLISCSNNEKGISSAEPLTTVAYPEAIGYSDYDANREVLEQNPVEDSLLAALNSFSDKTAVALLTDTKENANYSPLSLYFALAIAGSGASGETKSQIENLLGISEENGLSEQCSNLYRLLYTDNEISKLKIANSLWMDKDKKFKKIFTENAAKNFYASSYTVDFSDKAAGDLIGQWISEQTNGTLSPEHQVDESQILSIINTIYFYDEWINQFNLDMTAKDIFHAPEGDVTVDFMNQTFGSTGFVKGNGYTSSSLVLKGQGKMTFILPEEGISISELINSASSLQELFEGGEVGYGEVVWKIPKFSYDNEYELAELLKTLGMTDAFKPDADFTGITEGMAYITNILQQTHIAIDENGVEASAFTEIHFSGAAAPKGRAEMILNRPFLYGITERNGALLFVGICNNPDKN